VYRIARFVILSVEFLFATVLFAQGTSSQATATCNFDANNQLAVEYQHFSVNSQKLVFGHEILYNKVRTPGGKPMTLFTNSTVAVGGHEIPAGAYTLLLSP